MRGARDLLSVGLQYGNAFGRGFQAAALKPADFFGDDDVLYLMEDAATGEIRLSVLWEWLHKSGRFTADDEETGVRAGDPLTEELFLRLLDEEYAKLLAADEPGRARGLEDHDIAARPGDRQGLRAGAGQGALVHRPAQHQHQQHGPGDRRGSGSASTSMRSAGTARASPETSTLTPKPQRNRPLQ